MEECVIYGEARFSEELFTNELNMGLLLPDQVEKRNQGVETHRLSAVPFQAE